MNDYNKRIAFSLLALSRSEDINEAIKEWRYTGNCAEFRPQNIFQALYGLSQGVTGVCELCGHHPIVYHFEIVNDATGKRLVVGSECIENYSMAGTREVKEDRKKMEGEARKRSWLERLEQVKDSPEIAPIYSKTKWGINKFTRPLPEVAKLIARVANDQS